MRKADKLFQLTNLIRARQPITAQEIANHLSVNIRTVYRYIDDLSVSGIPIYGTPGIGYQLDDDFELPPLNITANELDALLLGVKLITAWTGEELSSAASSLAKKIEAVVPKHVIDEYADVIFTPEFVNPSKNKEIWNVLHKAIKNTFAIKITYLSLSDVTTNRTLYPLGLAYWGGTWTLAAWCTKRDDYRNFRVDRITHFSLLEKFNKTKRINLQAFMQANKKC